MRALMRIFLFDHLQGAVCPKIKVTCSCCRSVKLMIFSVAGAISFCGFQDKICMDVTPSLPHNMDHFNKKKKCHKQDPMNQTLILSCVALLLFSCLFSGLFLPEGVWPLKRCKELCTEMCVAVYYLNVSGLQSDRHSYNKENMFWTACFCLWLQCVDIVWWGLLMCYYKNRGCVFFKK